MSGAGSVSKLKWTIAAVTLAVAVTLPASASATVNVHGSANQVYVTGAQPNTSLRLLDREGGRVATKPVGSLGGVLFRRVKAGKGYRVREADGTLSARVNVFTSKTAPNSTVSTTRPFPQAATDT